MIFKHGVIPAFEDKRNKGEVRIEIGAVKSN